MIRPFCYPLYPNKAEEAKLLHYLWACCSLYNGALQERHTAWKKLRLSISLYDQMESLTEIRANDPMWAAIPVHVLRSALRRLNLAFEAFFKGRVAGQPSGYPHFKAWKNYDSFDCGSNAVTVRENCVNIPKIGFVKFNLYRPLRGKVLRVIVKREAGKWFVTFQCDVGAAPTPLDIAIVPDERAVGIDVGIAHLATLSNGEHIENPRYGNKSAVALANRQRSFERKRKGSKSRERAKLLIRKAYIKITNQRKNTAWIVAGDLVRRFDLIAYERLNIARMVHGNLAKAIYDVSWGRLTHYIDCKAEEAGKLAIAVDPRRTSQECSGCGAIVKKKLSVRVHSCPECSLVIDRDENAAINIAFRVLGRSTVTKFAHKANKARSPKVSKVKSKNSDVVADDVTA